MRPPKIAPIFREVELAFERHLAPRVRSQRLAAYALDKITEAKQINGGGSGELAPHRQIVDGREGAPLISVKPDGVIVARFDLLNDVLIWIGAELRRNSPVLSGRFSQSHVMYVDGEPHDPETPIPNGQLYTFVNVQPYARRIEKGWSKKVPDGLYEGIASVAGHRFGNVAKVTFGWQALQGATVLERWAGKTSMQRNDRDLKDAALDEWRRRQPTIFVRPH